MLGIIITIAIIAVVAYCVLKNYYPPIILLLAGLAMLVFAAMLGVDPIDAKKSTHFIGFDFVQAFTNQMKGRLPGLGLNIMLIAGFSFYMDRIGASKALVKLCVMPRWSMTASSSRFRRVFSFHFSLPSSLTS